MNENEELRRGDRKRGTRTLEYTPGYYRNKWCDRFYFRIANAEQLVIRTGRSEERSHNSCNFVSNEVRRLVDIITLHQEIVLKTSLLDREHQVSPGFHGRVASYLAPHLECVAEEGIFAGAFLVLGICRLKESLRKRVPMVPIKRT